MRRTVAAVVVVLSILIVTPVFCEVLSLSQARAQVREAFDKTAAWRESGAASAPNDHVTSIGAYALSVGQFVYDDSIFPLVSEFLAGPDSKIWRDAIASELSSPKPARRALACEILGLKLDASILPKLAALLSDTAQAPPVPQSVVGQRLGSEYVGWYKGTVGQAARTALGNQTTLSFRDKAAFDAWWQVNKDYSDRLWYWCAKWSDSGNPKFVRYADGRVSYDIRPVSMLARKDHSDDLAELSKLPKDKALELLLITKIEGVLLRQLDAGQPGSSAQKGITLFGGESHFYGPTYEEMAGFVKESGLKPRLIELLAHKGVWPSVSSDWEFERLTDAVCAVGAHALEEKDEAAIAAIQKTVTSKSAVQDLVMLRVKLAPERAREILTGAITAHPDLNELVRAYIARFGATERSLLIGGCKTSYDKWSVAQVIREAAQKKLPISSEFILELVQPLEARDQDSRMALAELARTTAIITGEEIASEDELRSLFVGKVSNEEAAKREEEIPLVFESIKNKVVSALSRG